MLASTRMRWPAPLSFQTWIVRALAFSIVLAALPPPVAQAAPIPATMYAPSGFLPKDFTLFRDGDWYHCFYIMTNDTGNDPGTRLGHSRSCNLYDWEYLGSPFGPDPNGWDNSRVWAPHIIKVDGVFYMFYTGVSSDAGHPDHQRIGVATSTDLATWSRASVPLMECSIATWTQCLNGVNTGGQLRDPFVMPDPATPGRWLAYYGANISWDYMLPGVAASTSLGSAPWSDLGPLWTRDTIDPARWWTTQGKVESPHLVKHGSDWYLFFTSNAGTAPITILTSPNPVGAGSNWSMGDRIQSILNASMGSSAPDANHWFASEYFKDTDGREYFASVADGGTRRIQIYEMTWQPAPDWRFALASPIHQPPLNLTSVTYQATGGGTDILEGTRVTITINAENWCNQTVALDALEMDPGAPDQVLSAAALSLSSPIALTGPSTAVTWISRFIPDDDATPDRIEISFRACGATCAASPVLNVRRNTGGGGGGGGPRRLPDERARPGAGEPEPAALAPVAETEPRLRALRETPLGSGIGLLVNLPEASQARLDVFDPLGRRVRLLADRPFPKGASVELWDGRSDAGTVAVTGVYFARLRTASGVRVARFFFSPR